MAKGDGNLPGPAVTGEGKRPSELTEDEKHELGAELEGERLREEEPDPNQHGPAVAGQEAEEAVEETGEGETPDPLEAWEDQYSMDPEEYLMRYGEDAEGSELATEAINARED